MSDQANSTATDAASQHSTASPAKASPAKVADFSAELTSDELTKLERDMQTLPADEVKIPASLGGGTLADLQQRRDAAHAQDGEAASKAQEKAMVNETSAVLPEKHKVTITADGQFLTSPVSPEVEPAKTPVA